MKTLFTEEVRSALREATGYISRDSLIMVFKGSDEPEKQLRRAVEKAVRKTLAIKRLKEAPHMLEFMPARHASDYGGKGARYSLDVTREEGKRVKAAVEKAAPKSVRFVWD